MTADDVLAELCGDRAEAPIHGSTARFGVTRLPGISGMRIGVTKIPGAVLMVEDNGYVGAQRDVLARISANGRAASMFWNVNEHTAFSYAQDGEYSGPSTYMTLKTLISRTRSTCPSSSENCSPQPATRMRTCTRLGWQWLRDSRE
jgi:Family of unknown function (DUF6461)